MAFSSFALTIQVVLTMLLSLYFCKNFRIITFYKKACWDFDWDCIKAVDQFGKNWHLSNIVFWFLKTVCLSIYLSLFQLLSAMFCHFQCISLVHFLSALSLSISYCWCYYKWYCLLLFPLLVKRQLIYSATLINSLISFGSVFKKNRLH